MENIVPLPEKDITIDQLGSLALVQRHLHWTDGRLSISIDFSKPITAVHKATEVIRREKGPALVVAPEKNGMVRLKPTSFGNTLRRLFTIDFWLIGEEYQAYRFSPLFAEIRNFAGSLPHGWLNTLKGLLPVEVAEKLVSAVARWVSILRNRLNRTSLKEAQQNFRQNAINNFNGLCDKLDWLAQRHRRVVVLRFDLFLRAAGSQPAKFGDKPDLRLLDAFLDFCERFHRSMDRQFGEALLGYAWALEHGRESGFHRHYVVILENSSHEDHQAVVELLGIKWEMLTDGRGYIRNGNKHSGGYLHPALGVVDLDDAEVIQGLRYIAAYFTLAGLYVKLNVPQNCRTFHSGRFPKKSLPQTGAGRPRKRSPGSRFRTAFAAYEKSRVSFM